MNDIMNFFGQQAVSESFDEIKISIASPEQIRSWSYGPPFPGRCSGRRSGWCGRGNWS